MTASPAVLTSDVLQLLSTCRRHIHGGDAAVIVTEMQTLHGAWYQLKPELLTVSCVTDTVICKQINDDNDYDDDSSCHCLALMTWPWSTGPSAVSSSQLRRVRHKKHLDNLRWAAGFSIPELLMTFVYTADS